jgi:co-chaperonin GroES (HSP10)
MMTIRPIKNRVLVRQAQKKEKVGSLYVPQGAEVYPPYARVIALGPTAFEDYPEDERPKIGDWVLFKRQPGSAINPDTREGKTPEDDLLILDDENIVGVLDREPEL